MKKKKGARVRPVLGHLCCCVRTEASVRFKSKPTPVLGKTETVVLIFVTLWH